MSLGHGASIVTNGLVLCLDAGNTKSYPGTGTTWTDLSGLGNNGTLVNGPTYSSANSGSLVFDGVNDYADCGNGSSLSFGNVITVIVSYYKGNTGTHNPIVSKKSADPSLAGWEIADSSGMLRATFRPTATQINIGDSFTTFSLNVWAIAALTFDGTTAKLYKNGVNTLSTSSGGPVTLNSSGPMRIATRSDGNMTNGSVGFVNVYNRALSSTEVTQNFNALRGRYGL